MNHTGKQIRLRQFLAASLLVQGTLLRFQPPGKLALLAAYFAVIEAVAGALSPLLVALGALLGLRA